MPQALVPIIAEIGVAIGGVAGASLIMYAGVYALGAPIIGSTTLKGRK